MWEWILLLTLVVLFVYMTNLARSTPPPGCKACAKRSENPVQ